MRYLRLVSVALVVVSATLVAGSAFAQSSSVHAPGGLKAFLLRASEPAGHEFPRTPSFTWTPVRGAIRYEFQLAKRADFSDNSIFWSTRGLRSPAVAPSVVLPWMTGRPYAAYGRVRAVTSKGLTDWSKPYGINLRWRELPKQAAGLPGLSRWTPVEGATGYEVWFTKIGSNFQKRVVARTTAVDHREAYTFHDSPDWTSEVRWRVRSVRVVPAHNALHANGYPTVSYGPWSREFVSVNPPQAETPLRAAATVSNGSTSKPGRARAHELTPAFTFAGREAVNTGPTGSYGLYRVYVASDDECVNTVYTGAVVGSPAYAPRASGPLALPTSYTPLDPNQAPGEAASAEVSEGSLEEAFVESLDNGREENTFMADLTPNSTTEQAAADGAESTSGSSDSGSGSGDSGSGSADTAAALATIDLPESGWPTGRFYWTVVPVGVYMNKEGKLEYHDLVTPQDQCAAGNVVAFGKASPPVVAGQGSPFASGLSPKGRLLAASGAQSVFYGSPLVAWRPVQGAEAYEVQWSRTKYPWRAGGATRTAGTSAVLPLRPGSWWYRIRAISPAVPASSKGMVWSTPLHLEVAKPKFAVVR
jgi:hypothetical protein